MLSFVVLRAAFSWEKPPDVDFLIRILVLLKGCVVLFWSALMSSTGHATLGMRDTQILLAKHQPNV